MKEISARLKEIKIRLDERKETDQEIRAKVKKVIGDITQKEPSAILEDLHLIQSVLIIKTKNKTAANELFLHKEQILEALGGTIKRIVVK